MRRSLSILFLFVAAIAVAQNTRQLKEVKHSGKMLQLTVSDGRYVIRAYNDNILETAFIPNGENMPAESHAIVLQPEKTEPKFSDKNGTIIFATKGIEARVTRNPFGITYVYKGKELISEKGGYVKRDTLQTLNFALDSNEVLYGGGARALGMNRRGNRLELYNKAHYGYGDHAPLLNFCIPMVLSSKMYAIHFDNAPIGYLDLDSKKNNTLSYETISGRKVYQVIAADTWDGITESYTALTGRQPMPPRWALGNFASRFGYHSEKQTREVVQKFRDEKIPLDAVVLDLYWFGKEIQGTLGNFEFLRDSFPTPDKMIADLKAQNVKTILITEPFVLTTSKKWEEAKQKSILAADRSGKPYTYDFYFGNTAIIDIFKPQGRAWFWNIYKSYINRGVAGWWGDLGEPEKHPSFVQHATGSANEVHNIYGHNWAKLVYEGYQKDFPTQRPFILMRAGYSGSQRYGMIPWSGDVGRSWGGLKAQPEIALQMGMQGMAYMHSDLGGFAGDNIDDELYVRWLQYGVFQPVFRPHAAESVPPEPVFRKPEIKALAKAAVELRYKLLPYNYTLSFLNSTKGTPLMRPMFFEEPSNLRIQNVSDQYLWGNAILVAPVMEAGVKEREIYFPQGSNWYSLQGQKARGGSNYKVAVEDSIPVYFRGGSFVPMLKESIQSTEEYSKSDVVIRYTHDETVKSATGVFYDDDGQTPDAYAKGEYELIRFESKWNGRTLKITAKSEKGKKYKGRERTLDIVVTHDNHDEKATIKLKAGGRSEIKFNLGK